MSVDDYSQLYADAGAQYGIDPQLLMAQGQAENSGKPVGISSAGASGIAQLMPDTAKRLGVNDPNDPKQAIPAQARLMRENLDRYGDLNTALMAYHGGTDQSNWGPKTHAYPAQVLKNLPAGNKMSQNNDPLDSLIQDLHAKTSGAQTSDSNKNSVTAQPSVNNSTDPLDKLIIDLSKKQSNKTDSTQSDPSFTKDMLIKGILPSMTEGGGIGQTALDVGGVVGGKIASSVGEAIRAATPQFVSNALTSGSNLFQSGAQNVANAMDNPTTEQAALGVGNLLNSTGNAVSGAYNQLPSRMQRDIGDVSNIAAGVGAVEGAGNILSSGANVLTSGAKALINPEAVYSKLANVVRTAPDVLGAEVPTQMFASSGDRLQRSAAKAFYTSDLESGINNKLVELTGANDAGATHTVLDEDAFKDAIKNTGNQYDDLHKAIGPVSLEKNYNAISDVFDSVDPSKQSLFSGIKKDLYSKLDDNAQISASDVKDLTGWKTKLDNLARNSDTTISGPAKEIKSLLKKSVIESATPEQADQYSALDNKYKLLKSMEPISNNLGAAPKIDPTAISKAVNRSYNKLTGASNPIQNFRYSLNTLYPNSSSISSILPEATGLPNGNLLSGQEMAYGLVTGNPQALALGAATRTVPKINNKISSALVNSDWYRNKLLQNSTHLGVP